MSTGRAAPVSYTLTHDGRRDPEADAVDYDGS